MWPCRSREIEGEVHKRLTRLARTVKVAGFRPGKAPLRMLDQQYGPQVRSDVISERCNRRSTTRSARRTCASPAMPRIEPQRGDEPRPTSSSSRRCSRFIPTCKSATVATSRSSARVSEVTPQDVDRTIEVLRQQRATYEAVDARGARRRPRAVVDFTGTIDGVEFPGGQARDFPIMLGEGRMLPEFEAALTGMKAGETKSFDADVSRRTTTARKSPARTAQFTLTVQRGRDAEAPALDAEFAKAFGIASGSVDDLRTRSRGQSRLELKRKVEAAVKAQALSGAASASDVRRARGRSSSSEAQVLRQRDDRRTCASSRT